MRRFIPNVALGVILALFVMLIAPVTVFAATTQDVAVNATPAYVSISNSPDNYSFGVVKVSTNYSTGICYFNVTNGSTVATDVSISCDATWAGGVTWAHDDTGTPGSDTAALYASDGDGTFNVIVKNGTPNDIVNNKAASTNWDWELRLMAPTVFTDGVLKTTTVTLTATAH